MASPLPKLASQTVVEASETAELPAPIGRTVLLCIVALIVGTAIVAWLGQSTAGTYVGYLHAAKSEVRATCDGRLEKIVVSEGQLVEPGATVAVLHRTELANRIAVARRDAETAEKALARASARAEIDLAWRLKQLEEELLDNRLRSAELLQSRFDQELKQQAWDEYLREGSQTGSDSARPLGKVSHETSDVPAGRIRALVEKEAAANAAEVNQVQIQLCEKRIAELEALKSQLQGQVRRAIGVEQAEAQLALSNEALAALESQATEANVVADAFGLVGVYAKQPGAQVAEGDVLVEILNEEDRFLLVEIPSRRLPEFRDGGIVLLTFPTGDERRGTVEQIPPQAIHCGLSEPDATVTLRITPTSKLWPNVPIGSAVTVTPGLK